MKKGSVGERLKPSVLKTEGRKRPARSNRAVSERESHAWYALGVLRGMLFDISLDEDQRRKVRKVREVDQIIEQYCYGRKPKHRG